MRALIAIALSVLLAGCWAGEALYSISDARPVMPTGGYRLVNIEGRALPKAVPVSVRPDGFTYIGGNDTGVPHLTVGFAPLDNDGRRFAAWTMHAPALAYGLLERAANGDYVLYIPSCDETGAFARLAGASVEVPEGLPPQCRFPNRASLEDALRRLPIPERPPGMVYRLTRLPHG